MRLWCSHTSGHWLTARSAGVWGAVGTLLALTEAGLAVASKTTGEWGALHTKVGRKGSEGIWARR